MWLAGFPLVALGSNLPAGRLAAGHVTCTGPVFGFAAAICLAHIFQKPSRTGEAVELWGGGIGLEDLPEAGAGGEGIVV